MLTRRSILVGVAAFLAGLKLPQVLSKYPIVRRLPQGGFYVVSEPQFVGQIPLLDDWKLHTWQRELDWKLTTKPKVQRRRDDSDIEAFYSGSWAPRVPVEPVKHFVTDLGSVLESLGTAAHLGSPAWQLFHHLAVERKPAESEHVRALERQLQAMGIVGLQAVLRDMYDPNSELFSLRMLTAADVHERDVRLHRLWTEPRVET